MKCNTLLRSIIFYIIEKRNEAWRGKITFPSLYY